MSTPAHAGECTPEQHKEIDTPGYDVDLHVNFGSRLPDLPAGTWPGRRGGGANDGDRKFDALRLEVRAERYDQVYASASKSIAGEVNRSESGTDSTPIARSESTLNNGWSGDGRVVYDIDRDGEGAHYWDLTGTPTSY